MRGEGVRRVVTPRGGRRLGEAAGAFAALPAGEPDEEPYTIGGWAVSRQPQRSRKPSQFFCKKNKIFRKRLAIHGEIRYDF